MRHRLANTYVHTDAARFVFTSRHSERQLHVFLVLFEAFLKTRTEGQTLQQSTRWARSHIQSPYGLISCTASFSPLCVCLVGSCLSGAAPPSRTIRTHPREDTCSCCHTDTRRLQRTDKASAKSNLCIDSQDNDFYGNVSKHHETVSKFSGSGVKFTVHPPSRVPRVPPPTRSSPRLLCLQCPSAQRPGRTRGLKVEQHDLSLVRMRFPRRFCFSRWTQCKSGSTHLILSKAARAQTLQPPPICRGIQTEDWISTRIHWFQGCRRYFPSCRTWPT